MTATTERERLAQIHALLTSLDMNGQTTREGTAWGSILRESIELSEAQPVQQPNRADMRRAIEATEVWRVMGFNIDPVLDAILAALPIPATGEEQWGTAHAGQPDQIVSGIDEARCRGEVRSWNTIPGVMRGETPRGLLFKRTVGPWIEVTP